MPIVADAAAAVRADMTGFNRDLQQGGEKATRTLGQQLKSVFSPRNLAIAGVAGGVAIAGAITAGLADAVKSLMDIERINAQTDAAIRSTGGAANITRSEIEAMAESLEKATGIQREAVQEGANLLLTFTNIRNQVGEGNDIFERATELALDMSVALGTDMSSASMQLGKALNDPIRGVSALSRAGVQLTEDQKELIRTFVESGNVLEAQKIILEELETQVGGSAEAFGETTAGKMQRAGNIVGDIFEGIVSGAVDMVDDTGDAFTHIAIAFDEHMNLRLVRLAERSGQNLQDLKDSIVRDMDETGDSFDEAADRADEQFGVISDSEDQLVEQSGQAWDTYQSQIRASGDQAVSAVRGFQGTILEQMEEGRIHVVEVALRMPGDIADALEDGRSAVVQAALDLKDAMEGELDPMDEIAALQGQLAGQDLADGLKSKDPIVRLRAQELYQTIQNRLSQLGAYEWGSAIAKAWADGIASQWGYAHARAVWLGTALSGPLEGESPPKEGPLKHIDQWGANIGAAWAEGLTGAANMGIAALAAPDLGVTPAPATMGGGSTIQYILQVEGKSKEVGTRDELYNAFDQLAGFGAGY